MDSNQDAYLLFKAEKGLKNKGLWDQDGYQARLKYEWETICRMGFSGYYLVVSDYCQWARENDIPVGPGRGSGAGSLVAYAVGITDIDSLKHGLMFERFLNPGRVSMPDFDIDFGQRRRSEVVQYCIDKYGGEKVCQIGTTGTMKSKLAVRDVARTMGYEPSDINFFSSLIPDEARGGQGDHAVTLNKCLNPDEVFYKAHHDSLFKFEQAYNTNKAFYDVINAAAEIEGIPKSFGVHPAGVIIANENLSLGLPLRKSKEGMPVSQWTDKQVENIGFVKFDFLGLRTLDVIQDACNSIYERTGHRIDWDQIDIHDPQTYELLGRGDCVGVFQLEAGGIAGFTRQFKPESIEDISTISALYRPGPLDNGMVKAILDVRSGGEAPEYPVQVVKDILAPTEGVLTYQEQILAIARELSGYSLAEADLLRRAIGKKLPVEMAKQREAFIEGAVKNHYSKTFAISMFDIIEKFADYCFNKSHSYSYSVLSFRTAYLKTHYPSDFYAAELSSWDGQVDKMLPVIADARKHNIKILPPDINISNRMFTAEDDFTVRFGLAGIKGLGEAGIVELLKGRSGGFFEDVIDLALRTNTRLKTNNLVALARSGALDLIEPDMNPLELEQYIPEVLNAVKKRKTTKKDGQLTFADIFDNAMTDFDEVAVVRPRVPLSPSERLELQKEALGLYVSGSPLDQFQQIKDSIEIDDIASLEIEDLYVTVLARVTEVKVKATTKGSYAFVQFDDDTGMISGKIWSNRIDNCLPYLGIGNAVVVRGKTNFYRGIEIVVDSVVPAMEELTRLRKKIIITKLDNEILNRVLKLSPGKTPIDLEISNKFRFRLGLFDVEPNYFEGIE